MTTYPAQEGYLRDYTIDAQINRFRTKLCGLAMKVSICCGLLSLHLAAVDHTCNNWICMLICVKYHFPQYHRGYYGHLGLEKAVWWPQYYGDVGLEKIDCSRPRCRISLGSYRCGLLCHSLQRPSLAVRPNFIPPLRRNGLWPSLDQAELVKDFSTCF